MRKRIIITFAVGLVLAFIIGLIEGIFGEHNKAELMKILTDMFSLSGILLWCVGALAFCTDRGAFRIFGYSFKGLLLLFQTSDQKIRERESYADYCERKGKNKRSVLHYFISGLILFCISIVFLIMFNASYTA